MARGGRWLAVCLVCAAAGLAALPAATSADPSCTDTWTGGAGDGLWQSAGNWSTESVPSASDVACIGSGVTVQVSGGTDQAAALKDEGALDISGGSLELVSTTEASSVESLTVSGGTLTGAGVLDVSGSLSWTGGAMSGSGVTVLETGAAGSIDPGSGSSVSLSERSLTNEGTLTWSTGTVYGEDGATITNSGTFDANGENPYEDWFSSGMLRGAGAAPKIVNTGTLAKTAGSGVSVIQFAVENDGTVGDTSEGQLNLWGGGAGGNNTGSWRSPASSPWVSGIALSGGSFSLGSDVQMSGTISLSGATVQAGDIQGTEAHLTLWGGGSVLDLTDTSTASHIKELTQLTEGGSSELTGAGTLDLSTGLTWNHGTMSGSGKTVLQSGATGSINPGSGSSVALTERELTNEGTLTLSSGSVEGRSNAEIDNSGTFILNAQAPGYEWWEHGLLNSDGSNVWLHNTGTVKKTTGSEFSQIQFQIDNEGTVEAKTGQIILGGGNHGSTVQDGSWAGLESGGIAFNAESYLLGSGVEMSGTVYLAGGNIKAGDIQAPDGTLWLWGGSSTLELTNVSSPSHVGTLNIQPNTTLTGAGTVDVANSLSWGGNSTMSGSGSTVLGSSATGSIEASSGCEPVSLTERKLVNEGTVTFGWGTWFLSEGAQLQNKGTFRDNSEASCEGAQIQDPSGSGAAPSILNTGSFEKTAGGGTSTVDVNFGNQGTVEAKTGTLDFADGGIPEEIATGSWAVQSGAHVVLSGGTFLISEAVDLSAVEVSGASVEKVPTSGAPKGHLEPHPYASGVVAVSGIGASVGTGFSSAGIEITPAGEDEWHSLCGPLTPGLVGEFSCSWNTASGSYADGKYQLRAQLSDSSEPPNTAPTAPITVLVDNTPPTGNVSAASYLAGTAAPVSGTAADGGSGVASWQLQITPAGKAEWTNACPAQTTPTSGSTYGCGVDASSDGDGAYELRALVTDNAGNEYTTPTVDTTFDSAPPAGTLDRVTETEYVRGTLSLEGTASDSISGVASWTPEILPAGSSTWTNACSPQSTPISGSTYGCSLNTTTLADGEYTVRVQVANNAGRTYDTATQTITVDNTPATGSLNALPRSSTGTIEVKGTAADALSGVASWQLEIEATGSGEWHDACLEQTLPSEGGDYGCSFDTTLLADGSYQLHAVIIDHAGNVYTTRPVSTHIANGSPTEGPEAGCTDNWTGEAGDGSWQTSGNWSTGAIPGPGDRACIPAGDTVHISGGTNEAGSLESDGELVMSGGTLDLTDGGTVSEAASLTESDGNITGSSPLDVSGSLSWTGGTMSGPGITVIGPEALASVGDATLSSRELVNEGTLAVGGQIASGWASPGTLLNMGTLQKSEGSETAVLGVVLENEGDVSVTSGSLELADGGATPGGHSGSWSASGSGSSVVFGYGEFRLGSSMTLSGAITVTNDAHVYTKQIDGADAQLTITANGSYAIGGGAVDVEGPAMSTIAKLEIVGVRGWEFIGTGTLNGAGVLDVTESFVGGNFAYMNGKGKTVIEPGASAVISGSLGMEEERTLENAGTLTLGADASIGGGKLINTGTLQKTEGSETVTIGAALDSDGYVSVTAGKLELTGGGNSGEPGPDSWSASGNGTGIVFNSSTAPLALGSSVTLSGAIEIVTGDVTAGTIHGASADMTIFGDGSWVVSTLEVDGEAPSTLAALTLTGGGWSSGGLLTGSGQLDITESFNAGYDARMQGTGSTVVESGATGSVSDSLSLEERTLENAGALTVGPTDYIYGSEGARILNSGTMTVNADHAYGLVASVGSATLINTGTLQKTEESAGPTPIGFGIDNEGLIKADAGQLEFTGGGESGAFASNSWVAEPGASIALDGFQYATYSLGAHATIKGSMVVDATISAGAIEGDGKLASKLGNITLTGLTPSVVDSITFEQEPPDVWVPKEQSLYVTSELEIDSSLTWGSGYADTDGPGTIVTAPGSTTLVDASARLDDGQFVNEGTVTWESGGISSGQSTGTFFVNRGTFHADAQEWEPTVDGCIQSVPASYIDEKWIEATYQCPVFENDGTFTVELPGRAEGWLPIWPHIRWQVDIDNYGGLAVGYTKEPVCPLEGPYGWTNEGCTAAVQHLDETYEGLLLKEGAEVVEPLQSLKAPAITGTPEEEQTLTANLGAWTSTPTPSYSYQWKLCGGEEEGEVFGGECEDIEGATSPTYLVEEEDDGYTLRVAITAKIGLESATRTSEAIGPIWAGEPEEEFLELEEEEETFGGDVERFGLHTDLAARKVSCVFAWPPCKNALNTFPEITEGKPYEGSEKATPAAYAVLDEILQYFNVPKGSSDSEWQFEENPKRTGFILRKPGTTNNDEIIRFMDPTERYEDGYMVYTNDSGQPIDPETGKPGGPNETHITPKYKGLFKKLPKWYTGE